MWSHTIKRPEKPGLISRIFGGGASSPPAIYEEKMTVPRPLQQQPQHRVIPLSAGPTSTNPAIPENQRGDAMKFMDKEFYNRWINALVALWPVGSVCTLRMFPFLLERNNPPPHFTVLSHQEIRHLNTWDPNHKEPRALCIRAADGSGHHHFVAPASIRPLTKTERDLIASLQNQQGQTDTPSSSEQTDNEGGNGRYAG